MGDYLTSFTPNSATLGTALLVGGMLLTVWAMFKRLWRLF